MMKLETEAVLDAIPDSTAVLSRDGTILAVNRAWRAFATENGADEASTGPGVNYVEVCTEAAAAGCADAKAVAVALRSVLEGESLQCDLAYPCQAANAERWFELRITKINASGGGALVSHVDITRRKMAEQYLARRGSEDPLTRIANRALFTQRVANALEPHHGLMPFPVGLLIIDLDGFKRINDSYGTLVGDELLRSVASRLNDIARPEDLIARLGGDEFAMLLPRMTGAILDRIAERIVEAFKPPHSIAGERLEIGASVGAYLAKPGELPAEALQHADAALYAVKKKMRLVAN
jgi:diguanylate cyclase (GGDEF)-like protein